MRFLPVAGVIRAVSRNWVPKFLCRFVADYYLRKFQFNKIYKNKILQPFKYKKQNFNDIGSLFEKTISYSKISVSPSDETKQLPDPLKKIVFFLFSVLLKLLNKTGLKRYLDWFNFMTYPYEEISNSLIRQYKEINIFIHHDMDMDDWYELDPSIIPYERQVETIRAFAKNSENKLLAFYAYNPQKKLDALKITIQESDEYIGVKFYPPSGFQPWYNNPQKEEEKCWQQRNEELFKFCEDNRIPILTHCSYGGMEAYKDAWKNSSPVYWEEVLKNYPKLKLCIGHAGGDEGWLGKFGEKKLKDLGHYNFEKSFAGQVFKLCTEYENVFCEFGYLPEVSTSGEREKFRKQLVWCINDSNFSDYKFESKICYGSDWHMILREHDFKKYYTSFVKLFDDSELKTHTSSFFGGNANNFLSY